MASEKIIYVYENFSKIEPVYIGKLFISYVRGEEVISFSFDKDYLKSNKTNMIFDPDLEMYDGRQYCNVSKSTFGMLCDSSPDRWGRILMQRKESILAEKEDRKPKKLYEIDYLLGVYDFARCGALRFKEDIDGDFLSSDNEMVTPPWVKLRSLEEAARNIDLDKEVSDKWLKQIIAPGSSLGGARPKANVLDEKGEMWIAKFPSKNDDVNKGAWEKVAIDLAKMSSINVPETKLEKLSKYGSTFLTKRFDRYLDKDNNIVRRVHMLSCMTLLSKKDNESASYLDIVSFIKENCINVNDNLKELFKRLVFNIAISNGDDHLRNHSFIYKDNSWILSPLYDVNPVPYGDELELDIIDDNNKMDFNLALKSAKYYNLDEKEATKIINKIKKIVRDNYEELAIKYGITNSEITRMKSAFKLCLM